VIADILSEMGDEAARRSRKGLNEKSVPVDVTQRGSVENLVLQTIKEFEIFKGKCVIRYCFPLEALHFSSGLTFCGLQEDSWPHSKAENRLSCACIVHPVIRLINIS
jgi:hypothetical protein